MANPGEDNLNQLFVLLSSSTQATETSDISAAIIAAIGQMKDKSLRFTTAQWQEGMKSIEGHARTFIGLIADFARTAHSPTRRDTLRLKDWLHLSLAYAFAPEQHATLADLARALVDPWAPVSWELRFYERHEDRSWICHARWSL